MKKTKRRASPSKNPAMYVPGKIRRALATLIVSLTVSQGLITAAWCQSPDVRTDLAADKEEFLQSAANRLYLRSLPAEMAPKGPFSIFSYSPTLGSGETAVYGVLDVPVTRITHPGFISMASTTTRVDPKFQFNAVHQFDESKLALASTADFDRYAHTSPANVNGLLSSLKWELNKLKEPRIAPYVFYQSSLAFTTDYGKTKSNLNDVGAGTKLKQAGTIGEDVTWLGGLEVSVTRRSTSSGVNSHSIFMKPSVTLNLGKNVSATFAPSIRTRWFDSGRRDRTDILPLQVAWDPPLLAELHGEVQFSMAGSRNDSTDSSKRTRQWEIGPTIELVFPLYQTPRS